MGPNQMKINRLKNKIKKIDWYFLEHIFGSDGVHEFCVHLHLPSWQICPAYLKCLSHIFYLFPKSLYRSWLDIFSLKNTEFLYNCLGF